MFEQNKIELEYLISRMSKRQQAILVATSLDRVAAIIHSWGDYRSKKAVDGIINLIWENKDLSSTYLQGMINRLENLIYFNADQVVTEHIPDSIVFDALLIFSRLTKFESLIDFSESASQVLDSAGDDFDFYKERFGGELSLTGQFESLELFEIHQQLEVARKLKAEVIFNEKTSNELRQQSLNVAKELNEIFGNILDFV